MMHETTHMHTRSTSGAGVNTGTS